MSKTPFTGLVVVALGLGSVAAGLLAPVAAQAAPTPTVAPAAATTNHQDWATAVLDELNAERAQNGLKALRRSDQLTYSAHRHNLAMAQQNTLSHQLPGEASLGDRVTVFYAWSSCGENIAWNSQRSQAGALALETSMYDETAPNDGHRRNILSTSFVDVGVDVIDDSTHGRIWLTTDFGRPR
ncbi:MAG: CAP domain-containing protein [Janthinobacterium lividum]